jgi:hypothetical protein
MLIIYILVLNTAQPFSRNFAWQDCLPSKRRAVILAAFVGKHVKQKSIYKYLRHRDH